MGRKKPRRKKESNSPNRPSRSSTNLDSEPTTSKINEGSSTAGVRSYRNTSTSGGRSDLEASTSGRKSVWDRSTSGGRSNHDNSTSGRRSGRENSISGRKSGCYASTSGGRSDRDTSTSGIRSGCGSKDDNQSTNQSKHNKRSNYERKRSESREYQEQESNLSQKRSRRRRRKNWRTQADVETPTSASTSNTDSSTDQCDIPGFYYDSIKKRYYKILENSNIQMAITKESIAKAEAEQKRLKDIKNLKEKNIKQSDEVIYGLIDLLFKSRQGDISHQKFKTTFIKNHATNLSLTDSIRVFHNPVHGHECLEHMLKMISSPNSDKLLCLWTVKDTIVQQLHLVEVEEKPRTNNKHSLSVELGKRHVIHSWHKITNVCWAPFQKFPGRKNILYTTNCHHTGQALVYIRDLDVAVSDDIALFDFRVGSQATWTCAWNKQTEKFSVGAEKTCLLIDVATRRLWELNTLNSDPLAQTFSSNNLLYNGTRKGQILSHDLRSSSTRPIRCMSHKSSISHLLLSYDENSIYASDFTGQLRVWDTRKNAVVMEYRGLYNEYKRIPFHIDESNTILYGAGQDGYTKIWCVRTGKMLLNLPPPCSVSLDTIPALQFSTRWANKPGNSGLLMGLGDKIYMYSNS